ncbi:MAG: T9SS type A sorting domain-containing protein [Bacteroidia bacterium]|nr:T9SS type A sorting domain-containing protein [Bacteroidia bacterium]MCZ2247499.1 T9SS type A sorting domain-containing protein [Bacteroidia bacterium]
MYSNRFSQFAVILCTVISLNSKAEISYSQNDTLNKQYFDSLSYSLYQSPGGGYVSGNNAYHDKAKVQEFKAGNLCNIFAVMMNFGYKAYHSLNDSSYLYINYYAMDNLGKTTASNSALCPGNIIFKDSLKVSDIDTTNGNMFVYNSPIFTDSNFAIGIDFEHLFQADTVALYTNKDGDAGNREQSWEQDASGQWYSLKYNWPLNADYAIFPIVNTSLGLIPVSTGNSNIIVFPNPSTNEIINVYGQFSNEYVVNLFNASFQKVPYKIVYKTDKNLQIQPEITSRGIYFLQVKSKTGISFNKIIIQ